jgi:hypothetical protein
MKRVGKKTREWERVRRGLKKRFMAAGITTCEVKLPQCWRSEALSFAHGKKRRELTGRELSELVVLSCAPCHTSIEGLSHDEMFSIVWNIIANRKQQP